MGKIYDRFERRKLENYYRVLTSLQSGDKDCAMGLLDKIEDSLLFEIKKQSRILRPLSKAKVGVRHHLTLKKERFFSFFFY